MRSNGKISIRLLILISFLLLCTRVNAQSMKSYIKDVIASQLQKAYPSDLYHFDVSVKWLPENIRKVKQDNINAVTFRGVGLPRDYVTYKLEYLDNGTLKKNNIQVYVDVEQKLPVALRRLSSGHTITSDDIVEHWVNITKEDGMFVSQPGKITGLVVKHIINKENPIRWNDLRRLPVIHPGDEVTLLYYMKGIRITLNCVARQPGAIGENVRLYSRETGKMYIGKVNGKSQAIWKKTL